MSTLLLSLSGIHLAIGGDPLFVDASLAVNERARIALVGRNGSGKSTLMKIAAGLVEADRGERFIHPDVTVRYLQQEPDAAGFATIGDYACAGLDETGGRHRAEAMLEELGLNPEQAPGGLSGGEMRRAAIVQALAAAPDILLLDEPTNHLDMDMREALAEALALFDGALVLVSHDRHLIGLACDRFWRVADGSVAPFDGDLDDYAAWLRSRDRNPAKPDAGEPKSNAADSAKQRRRSAAEQREKERPLKNRLKQLENAMATQEKAIADLEQQLMAPELYESGGQRAAELGQKQAELRVAHAANEEAWLETLAALEALVEA